MSKINEIYFIKVAIYSFRYEFLSLILMVNRFFDRNRGHPKL